MGNRHPFVFGEAEFRFSADLRVRFSETDAQGIVNNAVYLDWFEVARIAYLARFGGGYRAMIEHGFEAVTLETHVRYRAPCRFDDELRIWTRIAEPVRLRARFRFEYALERLSDPAGPVADGWTSHTTVDAATLAPVRMPDWLRDEIRAAELG